MCQNAVKHRIINYLERGTTIFMNKRQNITRIIYENKNAKLIYIKLSTKF